jgi:hypothetical protein
MSASHDTRPDHPIEQPAQEKHKVHLAPRGAFAFVMLILLFYAAYFVLTWYEVVLARGGV